MKQIYHSPSIKKKHKIHLGLYIFTKKQLWTFDSNETRKKEAASTISLHSNRHSEHFRKWKSKHRRDSPKINVCCGLMHYKSSILFWDCIFLFGIFSYTVSGTLLYTYFWRLTLLEIFVFRTKEALENIWYNRHFQTSNEQYEYLSG